MSQLTVLHGIDSTGKPRPILVDNNGIIQVG